MRAKIRTEQEQVIRARMLHTLLRIRRLRAALREADREAAAQANEERQQ